MFSSISAFFIAISEGFKSFTTTKEHQSETGALKSLKKKTKAIEYAEKIIFLVDNYEELASTKKYQKLRNQFFKYN